MRDVSDFVTLVGDMEYQIRNYRSSTRLPEESDAIRRDAGRGGTASLASSRGVQAIRYFCLSVAAAILPVSRCQQHHTTDTRQNMAFIDRCPEFRLLGQLKYAGGAATTALALHRTGISRFEL